MLLRRNPGFVHCIRVGRELVGHNHVNVGARCSPDVFRQCAGLRIFGVEEPQIAAALPDADYNFFGLLASVNAPADLLAAYVGLIHLYSAIQLWVVDLFAIA